MLGSVCGRGRGGYFDGGVNLLGGKQQKWDIALVGTEEGGGDMSPKDPGLGVPSMLGKDTYWSQPLWGRPTRPSQPCERS